MRYALICLFFVTFLAGLSAPASADEEAFAGYWDGAIELPGVSLGIRAHFYRGDDGEWAGTLDIPMQGTEGLPLADIVLKGDSIRFVLADVPGLPNFVGTLDGDTIGGQFTQNGQTFPFKMTRGTSEAPGRPQDPQPPFPYSSEDLTFKNGDIVLAGTLTVPEGDGPFPAVVMLTGSGPQNRDEEIMDHRPFLVIADHLSRRGIAVLRYDDRGVGGSSGDILESTTADFAEDALAAVSLLRSDPRFAPHRIGLVGHSEGGEVAPLAATKSNDIAFLVLLAPPGVPAPELLALQTELISRAEGADEETVKQHVALNRELTTVITGDAAPDSQRAAVRDIILRQNELAPPGSRPDDEVLENMVQSAVDYSLSPWMKFFLRHDPRGPLGEITVPVLALFGSLDLQVADTQNLPGVEAALAAAGNTDVTVRSMPGLNHLFQHATTGSMSEYGTIDETISPEVLDIVYEWISERFAGE